MKNQNPQKRTPVLENAYNNDTVAKWLH